VDSLGSLSAFVQTAESLSFVAAGRQLGISSSAVGKAVARLEARLGVRLLHRSTRSVALTPEGALFLERCRRILCEVEAAELELSQSQGAARGRLRVSLPHTSGLFAPALAGFMRAYPEIELDIDYTNRLTDVIDEGFDAVVRTGDLTDSRLMARRLGGFRKLVVASPDYLRRRGEPRAPEDLLGHACLRHRMLNSGKLDPWPLHRDGQPLDIDPPAILAANALEPQICLAEEGVGLACLPDFAVAGQLADGRLVPVLEPFVRYVGTFSVLWPASRYPSPKVRAFVDFMAENLFPGQRA